jgi:DnaJ-class molecular chaperone
MYGIIGVTRGATEGEIKAAYKQRCLEWHPDKWMDKPVEDRKNAETKFKV